MWSRAAIHKVVSYNDVGRHGAAISGKHKTRVSQGMPVTTLQRYTVGKVKTAADYSFSQGSPPKKVPKNRVYRPHVPLSFSTELSVMLKLLNFPFCAMGSCSSLVLTLLVRLRFGIGTVWPLTMTVLSSASSLEFSVFMRFGLSSTPSSASSSAFLFFFLSSFFFLS